MSIIQIKRGLKVNLPVNANVGELIYTTDENCVYVGMGSTLPIQKTADINALNTHMNDPDAHSSTANITYYINVSTGLDTNTGLTSGTPFKTIQNAINLIKLNLNHTIIINVAAGTYPENIIIGGFIGNGSITINGGTSSTYGNFMVNSFTIKSTNIPITIFGFEAISTTAIGFMVSGCNQVIIDTCEVVIASTTYEGIVVSSGFSVVQNCLFSNRKNGIAATNAATVYMNNCTGTLNTIGTLVTNGSNINRQSTGTYPKGTTATSAINGGVLR